MTPWQKYQQDLTRDDFHHDAAQENAVRHLQRLYDDLTAQPPAKKGFFASLFSKQEVKPIKGLYFWGGVGRGKTYLVDTFLIRFRLSAKCECTFTVLCTVYMMN